MSALLGGLGASGASAKPGAIASAEKLVIENVHHQRAVAQEAIAFTAMAREVTGVTVVKSTLYAPKVNLFHASQQASMMSS